MPIAEAPGHRPPVTWIIRAAPAQLAGRVDRGVRVLSAGPDPVTRPQRHHERQPGLRELAAEPVLVPVSAVGGDRPEREPRRLGPDREIRPDLQLGPEPRVVLLPGKCRAGVYGTARTG